MVKEGYKETEIGIIPENWNLLSAKNLMKIETGSRNTEHKSDNGKYLFFVRSQQVEHIDDYHYDCEAVLTAGDGVGTGKVFHYVNGKFDAHQRVYVMSQFKDIHGKFFYNYFKENFGNEVAKYTAKSSVDSVRRDMIAEMLIPVPNIEEQQKIAEALSDMDILISSLEKLIEKKKAIKQGAMQELLTGKKRLSGFSGEWIAKKIKDIADVGRGRVISQVEITRNIGGRYPVYSSQTSNDGIMGYLQTFDFEGEYITWTTDGVNAGTVFYRSGKFNCTNVCGTLKCKKDNTAFVARRLGVETPNYVATNLANPKLMNDVMKNIIVTLPPTFEEQTAIATILSNMDNEITALEQKLAKCQKLKQGMMQQLLAGKIRLV